MTQAKSGQAASPTSIRLTEATRKLLADAARKTRRSQSWLVEETLRQYLPRVVQSDGGPAVEERVRRLKELQGLGARLAGAITVEAIDARVRELRGDE